MTEKQRYAIFLLVGVAAFAIHNLAVQPWMLDDAFISFRYAQNLTSGHGLVYNPGEKVEGYTCFLWVLLMAAGCAIGFDPVFFSKLLGGAFGIGCLLLLARSHRRGLAPSATVASIASLLLGTSGVFTVWATSGMEVGLFAFLILLAVNLLEFSDRESASRSSSRLRRFRPILLGLVCALAALTRPEGLLFSALILWFAAQEARLSRKVPAGPSAAGGWRIWTQTVGAFAVLYVPYFVWRLAYYGALLPNTFYAKVGGNASQLIRGIQYLTAFIGPAFLILAATFAGLLAQAAASPAKPGSPARERDHTGRLLWLVGSYALYVVLVGGDAMPAFRFFTPIMPLLCLLAARGLHRAFAPRAIPIALVAIMVLWSLVQMRVCPQIHDHLRLDTVAAHGRQTGLWLRANAPRDAVVATNTAGTVAYYSGLRVIDMLGMTDPRIAHRAMPALGSGWAGHEKGDGAYVLSRRPDFILFDGGRGSEQPFMPSDREIYVNPDFRRLYSLRVERLASGMEVRVYQRRQSPPAP